MKISWIPLVAFLSFPLQLFANSGGYVRGGVKSAGDVTGFEPAKTENIRILDEKLDIALGSKQAKVAIRYLMRNETDEAVTVRFGFPIEELSDQPLYGVVEESSPTEGKSSGLKYCQDYRITAAGEKIETKWQEESTATSDKRFAGIAGWLISEIDFEPNEEIPVTIDFNSIYPLEESWVSHNGHTAAAVFKYRLSTAACWAGTLGKGTITLRPEGIPASDLKIIKPVNRFKRDGDNWVWTFKDLEPTMADDLVIEPRPAERTVDNYLERNGQWSVTHRNYAIEASSTLKPDGDIRYEAENLKEFYEESAWSEGAEGPGIGEWLELKPEVAKPLTGITLRPGYWGENPGLTTSNSELFKANSRPKTIRVKLNDEFTTTVNLPDEMTSCKIRFAEYTEPVETIRLTFEEVWKGEKYEDLCVSGIELHALLDEKPEIQPSR